MSLLSVLLTIRSILNEHPYHNVPEIEIERTHGDSERYNIIVKHETIRVALIQTINNPMKEMPEEFLKEIKKQTRSNIPELLRSIKEFEHLSGKEMRNDWLEIKATFQWNKLEEDLQKTRKPKWKTVIWNSRPQMMKQQLQKLEVHKRKGKRVNRHQAVVILLEEEDSCQEFVKTWQKSLMKHLQACLLCLMRLT